MITRRFFGSKKTISFIQQVEGGFLQALKESHQKRGIKLQSSGHSLLTALRSLWSLARLDLLLWRRMPWAIASALIPPLGMALMLVVLSLTVSQEPVALVIQSQGAYSRQNVRLPLYALCPTGATFSA